MDTWYIPGVHEAADRLAARSLYAETSAARAGPGGPSSPTLRCASPLSSCRACSHSPLGMSLRRKFTTSVCTLSSQSTESSPPPSRLRIHGDDAVAHTALAHRRHHFGNVDQHLALMKNKKKKQKQQTTKQQTQKQKKQSQPASRTPTELYFW